MSGRYKFRAALTDKGICQVFNGNSMSATYSSAEKSDRFKELLDARAGEEMPEMIQGAGILFRKIFWLDIGER